VTRERDIAPLTPTLRGGKTTQVGPLYSPGGKYQKSVNGKCAKLFPRAKKGATFGGKGAFKTKLGPPPKIPRVTDKSLQTQFVTPPLGVKKRAAPFIRMSEKPGNTREKVQKKVEPPFPKALNYFAPKEPFFWGFCAQPSFLGPKNPTPQFPEDQGITPISPILEFQAPTETSLKWEQKAPLISKE